MAYLERACDALSELFGELRLSQVYETQPVGCPPGSPTFLNACVEVYTTREPENILESILRIEEQLGRKRHGVYGEPRTCDIDLLYCGEEVRHSEHLTLPHPRIAARRFVLQPLCDIDPELRLPGLNASVRDLLERLQLFDEYTGRGVPAGMRSLAWRLTFRHPERTLRDREIEGRRSKILSVLDQELHVRARTS